MTTKPAGWLRAPVNLGSSLCRLLIRAGSSLRRRFTGHSTHTRASPKETDEQTQARCRHGCVADTSSSRLLRLPPEILLEILAALTVHELSSFARTSRSVRSFVTAHRDALSNEILKRTIPGFDQALELVEAQEAVIGATLKHPERTKPVTFPPPLLLVTPRQKRLWSNAMTAKLACDHFIEYVCEDLIIGAYPPRNPPFLEHSEVERFFQGYFKFWAYMTYNQACGFEEQERHYLYDSDTPDLRRMIEIGQFISRDCNPRFRTITGMAPGPPRRRDWHDQWNIDLPPLDELKRIFTERRVAEGKYSLSYRHHFPKRFYFCFFDEHQEYVEDLSVVGSKWRYMNDLRHLRENTGRLVLAG